MDSWSCPLNPFIANLPCVSACQVNCMCDGPMGATCWPRSMHGTRGTWRGRARKPPAAGGSRAGSDAEASASSRSYPCSAGAGAGRASVLCSDGTCIARGDSAGTDGLETSQARPGQAGRRGHRVETDVVVLFGNGGRARDPAALPQVWSLPSLGFAGLRDARSSLVAGSRAYPYRSSVHSRSRG